MLCHLIISDAYAVELRELETLLAVVRCGSFTEAARQLGYTQSAVSQQIASLERELGHPLLLRRPVRPTPAGARLAEHAGRILLRLDVARSELRRSGDGPRSAVVVACPLAVPALLAAALREERAADPGLACTVRSADRQAAVEAVAAGEADVALVDGVTAADEPLDLADAGLLSAVAIAEQPLVVALPAGHPLARRRQLDLAALADAPWIAAPWLMPAAGGWASGGQGLGAGWAAGRQGTAAGSGHEAAALTGAAGAPGAPPPGLTYEGTDVATLLALVAAGHGAALLPAPACAAVEGVVGVPIGGRLVHRSEVVVLRNGLQPHHERLVAALRARSPLA